MGRIIGVRHRVKLTKEGEARPTQIAIVEDGKIVTHDLKTEDDELDWLLARFPTAYRKLEPEEELHASVLPHHVKWTSLKDKIGKKDKETTENLDEHVESDAEAVEEASDSLVECVDDFHVSRVKKVGKKFEIARQIPVGYDGYRPHDQIAMMLGGSGDNLAFALTRLGQEIGSEVFRISPAGFKTLTGRDRPNDGDAATLADLLAREPGSFYEVGARDLSLIWLRECLHARVDAMEARIACEQRLRQHLIGKTFCSPEGKFPEGDIEKRFDDEKANDKIYLALKEEEGKREKELAKACEKLDVYTAIFKPIEGCGPKIASRIIGAVIDIRRFERAPDEKELSKLWLERGKLETSIGFDKKLGQVASICAPDANRYSRSIALRHFLVSQGGHESDVMTLDRIIEIHQLRSRIRRKAFHSGRAALRAFCGVHMTRSWVCSQCKKPFVATHGACPKCNAVNARETGMDLFPRRRNGGTANWQGDCRQALYLLADQFNRRPKSAWGVRLLAAKAKYRAAHPEPVVTDKEITALFRRIEVFFRENGVQVPPADFPLNSIDGLYAWFRASVTELGDAADDLTPEINLWEERLEKAQIAGKTVKTFTAGHILSMAQWYTVGKFVEQWIFPKWYELEHGAKRATSNGSTPGGAASIIHDADPEDTAADEAVA